jgi:hypothetical protein
MIKLLAIAHLAASGIFMMSANAIAEVGPKHLNSSWYAFEYGCVPNISSRTAFDQSMKNMGMVPVDNLELSAANDFLKMNIKADSLSIWASDKEHSVISVWAKGKVLDGAKKFNAKTCYVHDSKGPGLWDLKEISLLLKPLYPVGHSKVENPCCYAMPKLGPNLTLFRDGDRSHVDYRIKGKWSRATLLLADGYNNQFMKVP